MILFNYFKDGKLPANAFNEAMSILKKAQQNLSDRERKIRQLVLQLTEEQIDPTTYLRKLAALKETSTEK
ncbi:MAG: hypothetical protein GWN16_06255, partial [Calditrichae bacterium]|nr:hypothetical protein [Calditrichia bacterium]